MRNEKHKKSRSAPFAFACICAISVILFLIVLLNQNTKNKKIEEASCTDLSSKRKIEGVRSDGAVYQIVSFYKSGVLQHTMLYSPRSNYLNEIYSGFSFTENGKLVSSVENGSGYLAVFYDDSVRIREVSQVIDGFQSGTYIYYNSDGTISELGEVKVGGKNGYFIKVHKGGNIPSDIKYYKSGTLISDWSFSQNGAVVSEMGPVPEIVHDPILFKVYNRETESLEDVLISIDVQPINESLLFSLKWESGGDRGHTF